MRFDAAVQRVMSLWALLLAAAAIGCGKSPAEACAAEGGHCVIGGIGCVQLGVTDCDPDMNPGGAVCCLGMVSPPGASARVPPDALIAASAMKECGLEGGQCVLGSVQCARRGTTDCNPSRDPSGRFCCLDAPPAVPCAGGPEAWFSSADYDQSCTTNADCIAVPEGDVCFDCVRACAAGHVGRNALEQYNADVASAVGTPLPADLICNCPAEPALCCVTGKCQSGSICSSTTP